MPKRKTQKENSKSNVKKKKQMTKRKKKKEKKTDCQRYQEEMDERVKELEKRNKIMIQVQGIQWTDDDEMTDDEGEHYVTANLKYDRIKNDFKHMEVDEDVEKRFDSIKHDIFNADTRYSPQPVSSGFFMWNTWSSSCMHRVILSYLDFGEKLWKRKKKVECFNNLLALTLALDQIDHYYTDTDDPAALDEIGRFMTKEWLRVLKQNNETYDIGEETRQGILTFIARLDKDWRCVASEYTETFTLQKVLKKHGKGFAK